MVAFALDRAMDLPLGTVDKNDTGAMLGDVETSTARLS